MLSKHLGHWADMASGPPPCGVDDVLPYGMCHVKGSATFLTITAAHTAGMKYLSTVIAGETYQFELLTLVNFSYNSFTYFMGAEK